MGEKIVKKSGVKATDKSKQGKNGANKKSVENKPKRKLNINVGEYPEPTVINHGKPSVLLPRYDSADSIDYSKLSRKEKEEFLKESEKEKERLLKEIEESFNPNL